MVVAFFLLGLALPAVRRIGRSSKVDTDSSMVAGELRVARQYAITHNQYVAVLMPTAQGSNAGGVDDVEYKARAIRSCTLVRKPQYIGSTMSWRGQFDAYLPSSKWSMLHAGIFIGATDTHGDYGPSDATCRTNTVDAVSFPTAISPTTVGNLRAIIFKPNGSVVPAPQGAAPGTKNTTLVVFMGVLDLANKRVLAEDGGLERHDIRLNRFTGKLDFLN